MTNKIHIKFLLISVEIERFLNRMFHRAQIEVSKIKKFHSFSEEELQSFYLGAPEDEISTIVRDCKVLEKRIQKFVKECYAVSSELYETPDSLTLDDFMKQNENPMIAIFSTIIIRDLWKRKIRPADVFADFPVC